MCKTGVWSNLVKLRNSCEADQHFGRMFERFHFISCEIRNRFAQFVIKKNSKLNIFRDLVLPHISSFDDFLDHFFRSLATTGTFHFPEKEKIFAWIYLGWNKHLLPSFFFFLSRIKLLASWWCLRVREQRVTSCFLLESLNRIYQNCVFQWFKFYIDIVRRVKLTSQIVRHVCMQLFVIHNLCSDWFWYGKLQNKSRWKFKFYFESKANL